MGKKKVLLTMVIGLFCVTFVVASAMAAAIEIKLGHVDPTDPFVSKKGAGALAFKDYVESRTGGAVEVKLFADAQLGAERELVEATKLGSIQMTMVSGGMAGHYKKAMLLDIPYLFSSAPVAWRTMDGWFGQELAADMLKELGLRVLFYGETGFRNFTSSVRPIKSPADLKGLKIRVMESPIYINLVKSLGAAATPMPGSEMYTAMQQKVVDGQENPVAVIVQYKMYEVQKYVCLDGDTYGCDFWVMNEKFFQSLPKETQAIVKQGAVVAGTVNRGIQTLLSILGVNTLKEKGMEIYTPNAKELAMFREAAQKPLTEYVEKQIGKEWVDKILKAAKESEASLSK